MGCHCDKDTVCTPDEDTLTIQDNYDENCPGENGSDGKPGRS